MTNMLFLLVVLSLALVQSSTLIEGPHTMLLHFHVEGAPNFSENIPSTTTTTQLEAWLKWRLGSVVDEMTITFETKQLRPYAGVPLADFGIGNGATIVLSRHGLLGGVHYGTAAAFQFPWVVGFVEESEMFPFCTGSLIGPNWVITAGHCFHDIRHPSRSREVSKVRVEIGRDNMYLDTGDEREQRRGAGPRIPTTSALIASVIVHPTYRQSHDLTMSKQCAALFPGTEIAAVANQLSAAEVQLASTSPSDPAHRPQLDKVTRLQQIIEDFGFSYLQAYDVALVQLDREVVGWDDLPVITDPTQVPPRVSTLVAGFGQLEHGKRATELAVATMEVARMERATKHNPMELLIYKHLQTQFAAEDSRLYTRGKRHTVDVGDSGGPFFVPPSPDSPPLLLGAVQSGRTKTIVHDGREATVVRAGVPVTMTRIFAFTRWMQDSGARFRILDGDRRIHQIN